MTAFPSSARDLSERLSGRTLEVCRTYLSNGRRSGRYWNVGDVHNSPGRSLFVRLAGPIYGRGAAGHWIDAATGQHGDLLDLLRLQLGLRSISETLDEARRFLSLPAAQPTIARPAHDPGESARRLFAMGRPVPGTLAERYLRGRGITTTLDDKALRFHPGVYCRERGRHAALPALLAAVTDLSGRITAVQRTWIETPPPRKAWLREPRRSLGDQLGHGVRFAATADRGPRRVLLVGEGVETVLSLRSALPHLAMVAGLSANHLGALLLPSDLRRLYVARDRDPDGECAATRLRERAEGQGAEVVDLVPRYGDFNVDLRRLGLPRLWADLLLRLVPEDRCASGRTE